MAEISKRRYAVVTEMIDVWEREGVVDKETARRLRGSVSPLPFDWRRAARWLLILALCCFAVGIAALLQTEWLVALIRRIFGSAPAVKSVFFAALAAVFYAAAYRRRLRRPERVFTNEALLMLGVLSTASSIAWLGAALGSESRHFSLLLALAARMANIEEVKDEVLAYTYQQLFVVSSSFDNPLNFQFILRGEIPLAYSDGEKVLKNRTLDKELMTYWAKGEFTSETQCPEVRRFLSEMSECLPALVAALSASMEANFRLFNPNSEFPLVCQAPGADDAFVNSDKIREKDIVVLATWSFVYVLSAALRRSSMMDAELFKYLIVAGGRKSMPGTLFASLSGDIKSVIVPSPSEQYSALGPVGKKLNIMAAAVAVGMHVTATLVTYWPIVTQSYINDKNVKAVMLVESVESKILHREAAYLLSHFMRWMGRNPSIGRVMRFIYMNLEQFEMFTRWNSEMTTDLISQRTEAQHIESLEKHAAAAELKITIAKKSK